MAEPAANTHIIGLKVDGQMGRFLRELKGEEFETLIGKAGGRLPTGFVVWHIPSAEAASGSRRLDRIQQLPLITERNLFAPNGWSYADPANWLLGNKGQVRTATQ